MGLVFAALGIATASIASGYPGASGLYPAALGGALAVLGFANVVKAARASSNVKRSLADNPTALAVTVVAASAYLVLVPVIGFFTSSALLVLILPVALGLRRPVLLVSTAVIFVLIVYVLFTLVLERPLPPEFWQAG